MNLKLTCTYILVAFFFSLSLSAQHSEKQDYTKYIDSADHVVDDSPELAEAYLDSIPKPLKKHIKGHLAAYYQLRGLISNRRNKQSEVYQNFLLALNYAKQEKEYKIAGMASIELFYNTYIIKKDSSAFHYLDDAKEYFTKVDDTNGLAEVMQMYAYVELYNENYAKSNILLLEHLDAYKNIREDQYYYMYALFMLSVNHIHLKNLRDSHLYFNMLKTLKSDPTIPKVLYDLHEVSIFSCLAEYHLEQKNIDSTLFYLEKSKTLRYAMNNSDIKDHFNMYADYYHHIQDLEKKSAYVDSLKIFENNLVIQNLEASLTINKELENSVHLLESESNQKRANRNWAFTLLGVLVIISVSFLLFYKKHKKKIREFINKINKTSYLTSNHEKLKAKVIGLEQYILEVKDEVKTIATLKNPQEIRDNVKSLYKNIHLKFSTELANSENHLKLINELNTRFFSDLKELHPVLNDSEIIICYYLFIGFKNKEIASLLNTSTRAVESKRFRISKKIINPQQKEITLVAYLQDLFSEPE